MTWCNDSDEERGIDQLVATAITPTSTNNTTVLPFLLHKFCGFSTGDDHWIFQVEWVRVLSKFGCASYMWCLSVKTKPYTFGNVDCCSLRDFHHHGTFLIFISLIVALHFPSLSFLGIMRIHWKICVHCSHLSFSCGYFF